MVIRDIYVTIYYPDTGKFFVLVLYLINSTNWQWTLVCTQEGLMLCTLPSLIALFISGPPLRASSVLERKSTLGLCVGEQSSGKGVLHSVMSRKIISFSSSKRRICWSFC